MKRLLLFSLLFITRESISMGQNNYCNMSRLQYTKSVVVCCCLFVKHYENFINNPCGSIHVSTLNMCSGLRSFHGENDCSLSCSIIQPYVQSLTKPRSDSSDE